MPERGTRRRTERKKYIKFFDKVIAEKFPNLGKESVSQAMEMLISPNTRYTRKTTSKHIIIKMAKIKGKDRVLKEARDRKKITYKENPSGYHQTSQQKPYRPEGSGMMYLMQ